MTEAERLELDRIVEAWNRMVIRQRKHYREQAQQAAVRATKDNSSLTDGPVAPT